MQQSSTVVFPGNVYDPEFITVSGAALVQTFVLNPGRWTLSLRSEESIFVVSGFTKWSEKQICVRSVSFVCDRRPEIDHFVCSPGLFGSGTTSILRGNHLAR